MVITNELTSTSPTQLVQGQKYTANKPAGMVTVPSSGHGEKLGFPISNAPGQGRGKQGGTLRNCVYYQNRFIILDPVEDKVQLSTVNAENRANKLPVASDLGDLKRGWQDGKSESQLNDTGDLTFENYVRAANTDSAGRNHRKTGGMMEMDASSVTMVPRGIEVVIDDGEGGSPRRLHTGLAPPANNSIWKKIVSILQDNRMKGRDDWEAILNSTRPEDHRMLKKILNIIFLFIGISLLLSVIIVVIYATVVESTRGPYIPPNSNDLPDDSKTGHNNNTGNAEDLSGENSVNFDLDQLTYRQ